MNHLPLAPRMERRRRANMKGRFAGRRYLLSIPLALVFTLVVAGASPANAEIAFVGLTYYEYCPEPPLVGASEAGCYAYWIPYIATAGANGSFASPVPGGDGGSGPAWSPDGARIAFVCEVESGNPDICAVNADGTGLVRLTSDPFVDSGPSWSPDRGKLAFSSSRTGQFELYLMNPDGSGVTPVGGG